MRATLVLLMVATLCQSLPALAMEREPEGFRGVQWGADFEQYRDQMTVLRNEGDAVYYRRAGDELKIGRVDALKVAYRFYKGRFSTGVIQTYGGANQKSVLETIKDMHGEPVRPRKRIQQYFWDGEQSYVMLACEVTSYCLIEFVGKAQMMQEQADTGVAPTTQKRDDD
ncbi:MAG: hypothetical protein ACKVP2_18670 [Burkholderiales bacterium]